MAIKFFRNGSPIFSKAWEISSLHNSGIYCNLSAHVGFVFMCWAKRTDFLYEHMSHQMCLFVFYPETFDYYLVLHLVQI